MNCDDEFVFPRRQILRAAGGLFLAANSVNRAWARSDPQQNPVACHEPAVDCRRPC